MTSSTGPPASAVEPVVDRVGELPGARRRAPPRPRPAACGVAGAAGERRRTTARPTRKTSAATTSEHGDLGEHLGDVARPTESAALGATARLGALGRQEIAASTSGSRGDHPSEPSTASGTGPPVAARATPTNAAPAMPTVTTRAGVRRGDPPEPAWAEATEAGQG